MAAQGLHLVLDDANAADALGVDEHAVVKTLVARDDEGKPLIVLMHGDREESLQAVHKLASRYGERFPLPRLTYVFAFERLS